jgi:hypothetical protein
MEPFAEEGDQLCPVSLGGDGVVHREALVARVAVD